jgi:glycosyltransferase involved in cell wall biosynthesis
VPEEEKWAILRSADLFFAPSREEGWGIAVGEALTAGIPVVAYDLPAYAHFGEAVIRVSRGDVDSLATTVLELLLSPDRMEKALANVSSTRLHHWESILEAEVGIIKDSFMLRSER